MKKIAVKLFVEGGGDSNALRTDCRAAFSSFLQKAGLSGIMPVIVASGSRKAAYDDYCTAVRNNVPALLLVDSECDVIYPPIMDNYNPDDMSTWKPWHHLKNRQGQDGAFVDNWDKPAGANDCDCHLMVQVMEAWFLTDMEALKRFYKQNFSESTLPERQEIENIPKQTVIKSLEKATKDTQKGQYSKGGHSFELLAIIDPQKVMKLSPWANRFVSLLIKKMTALR